jgi:hypothetical protein
VMLYRTRRAKHCPGWAHVRSPHGTSRAIEAGYLTRPKIANGSCETFASSAAEKNA